MPSRQEQLIRAIQEHSAGAPFIFSPDEYRKGAALREPSDLAWICNKSAVLFWMQDSARGMAAAAAHNLRQAKGWLRSWRRGVPLCGENSYLKFEQPFDPDLRLALISVTGSGPASLHNQDTIAADLDVDAYATVSDQFLIDLARANGSMLDLVRLILQAATPIDPLAADATSRLNRYLTNAVDPIREMAKRGRQHVVEQEFASALRLLVGSRLPAQRIEIVNPNGAFPIAALLNDLCLSELLELAFAVASVRSQASLPPFDRALRLVETPAARFTVSATRNLRHRSTPTVPRPRAECGRVEIGLEMTVEDGVTAWLHHAIPQSSQVQATLSQLRVTRPS